jgi:hypothetical protein
VGCVRYLPQSNSQLHALKEADLLGLASLLGVLLCAQIFLFGGREVVTAGLTQYSVAGVLAGWVGIAVVTRRKSPADPESWVARLMRVPRLAEALLMAAYICAAASWLNVLAAHTDARFCTTASALTGMLGTLLFFGLARYQDVTTEVLKDAKGRKRVRATVAWVILMAYFALPLVGGGVVVTVRKGGWVTAPELLPSDLALLWLCFCSVFLAAVLFRPWVMRMSSKTALPVLVTLAIVVGASALLEEMWRLNWYLYTLTCITFLGNYILGVPVIRKYNCSALPEGALCLNADHPG